MAQTKSKLTIEDILAGIDERMELLTTIKAAVRYAFTSVYQEETEQQTEAPTQRMRSRRHAKRGKTYAMKGSSNKALFLQALGTGTSLSTDDVYEWLKTNNWHTTSGNPRYLVAVTLRHLVTQGLALRGADGHWSLVRANESEAPDLSRQVA